MSATADKGEREMGWNRKYALRSYVRSALWIIPLGAYLTSMIAVRVLSWLDDSLGWTWYWKLELGAAQSALVTIIGATLSFIVFTFSSLLVAIQIASAQLTPRIIATTLLRDNAIRAVVTLLFLTFVFCFGVLARTQTTVPYLLLTIAVVLGCSSIAAFVFLIDYAARLLRPVTIVWLIGEKGLAAIEDVYPAPTRIPRVSTPAQTVVGLPARTVEHRGKTGIVLAADLGTLVAEAERTNGVIEFALRVGDFAAVGEPLFFLYGGAVSADEQRLRGTVALGRERTIEQDATFAFRIIVDIAIKALSKAINDPTTAVLSIDQLHRMLRVVGRRHLHDDVVRNASGQVRVVFRTPNWDDFVQLACREIRIYGAENFQVARRLRAMLMDLLKALPESRRPALQEELELLDWSLKQLQLEPRDLAVACTPDLQGLGGSLRA
jgi:uncharacterized membrane protein